MGARGPQKGFRQARAEQERVVAAEACTRYLAMRREIAVQPLRLTGPALTTAQQNNPVFLGGDQLRNLAYSWGMARSTLVSLSDERIREQLRFITQRRIDEND